MRPPDWHAYQNRAWVMAMPPDKPTTLGRWLLHCPGVHMIFEHWCMSLAHLRPVPGYPPAAVPWPGASHEIAVYALDPRNHYEPDERPPAHSFLQPPDQVQHFQVLTDELAVRVGDELTRMCMIRELHPDSDYRRYWQFAVGAAITRVMLAREVS